MSSSIFNSCLSQKELSKIIDDNDLPYECGRKPEFGWNLDWRPGARGFAKAVTRIPLLVRVRVATEEGCLPVLHQLTNYKKAGLILQGDGAENIPNEDKWDIAFFLELQAEVINHYVIQSARAPRDESIIQKMQLTPDSIAEKDKINLIKTLPTIFKPYWVELFFGAGYLKQFPQFAPCKN